MIRTTIDGQNIIRLEFLAHEHEMYGTTFWNVWSP